MNNISANLIVVDAIGKPCPMPLLMLKRALKSTPHAQFLLKSSDPHSQQDVLRYCQIHRLNCQLSQINSNEFHYTIES